MRAETIAMNQAVAARIDAALATRPAAETPPDLPALRAEFEARLGLEEDRFDQALGFWMTLDELSKLGICILPKFEPE